MRIGYIGLALMVLFIIGDLVFKFPRIWKLALFAPTVYSLSGFIQARNRFCFVFGFLGIFSFKGKKYKVGFDQRATSDRLNALWILVQIILGSIAITWLYYLLAFG